MYIKMGVKIMYLLPVLLITAAAGAKGARSTTEPLPNILVILTDDQDVALHGMFPMQQTAKLVGLAGTNLVNAFSNTPLCCPARASLLSGMYAHNHHTKNNSLSGGCNGHSWRSKIEPKALPVLLQQQGYRTFYAGKYLNQYKGATRPAGWHEFYGLHGNSRYFNYTLRENARNVSYTTEYLTDVLKNHTLNFLANSSAPFFAMVSPPAAHAPFTPAERHRGAFAGIRALRTPNFNHVADPLEKHWLVAATRKIPEQTLETMDTYFQQRWETLLSVDEMIADLVKQLTQMQQLENTYIVFTSDNGYHVGQFAQPFDKRQPYETDIRVPMLIRGPGIKAGTQLTAPVSLVDLAPTILEWANVDTPNSMDGMSFKVLLHNASYYDALLDEQFKRNLLIEYWGEGNDDTYNPKCPGKRSDHLTECTIEADCHCQDSWNNTYACVRNFEHQIDRVYCRFSDTENFVEAYDLNEDPYQMTNIGYDMLPIEAALFDLALDKLKKCTGAECHNVHV